MLGAWNIENRRITRRIGLLDPMLHVVVHLGLWCIWAVPSRGTIGTGGLMYKHLYLQLATIEQLPPLHSFDLLVYELVQRSLLRRGIEIVCLNDEYQVEEDGEE